MIVGIFRFLSCLVVTSAVYVGQPCCFPNQFYGILHPPEQDSKAELIRHLIGSGGHINNSPFRFSVNYQKERICGEYIPTSGAPSSESDIIFCADLQSTGHGHSRHKQVVYVLDKTTTQCVKFPTSGRLVDRCLLENSKFYAGNKELKNKPIKFALKHRCI